MLPYQRRGSYFPVIGIYLTLKFQRLLQGEGRTVVTVVSNNGDGTSTVATRDGVQITVKGESVAPTNKAMIEGGELRYEMPSLATSVVEV